MDLELTSWNKVMGRFSNCEVDGMPGGQALRHLVSSFPRNKIALLFTERDAVSEIPSSDGTENEANE